MDGPATAFVPGVFTAAQASWIDSALAAADGFSEPIRSLLRLVIIRVVLHLQPMSMLDGTDAWRVSAGEFDAISPRRLGHYLRADQALTPAAVERIAQAVNQGVIGGRGACRHGDAVEVVAAEQADILYCDPPYPGTTGYRDPYAPLRLLLGDSMAEQPASLEALLEAAAHIPVALISYGGRGVTLDTLVAAVSLHRRVVRAIEVPFPHLRSLARKEVSDANREFIVVAVR